MSVVTELGEELVNLDAVPPDGDFYVTVRRRVALIGKVVPLLGPYTDLRDAIASVPAARELAESIDGPPAHFYNYATVRVPKGTRVRTVARDPRRTTTTRRRTT